MPAASGLNLFNLSGISENNCTLSVQLFEMDRKTLQQRTKQFHIDVIKLCEELPRNAAGFEIAKQIIRCAGSVGANYGRQ